MCSRLKNQSNFELAFEEMGHTRKNGLRFKKWFTLKKLVIFNKVDHIWRNVFSRLKKLVKL